MSTLPKFPIVPTHTPQQSEGTSGRPNNPAQSNRRLLPSAQHPRHFRTKPEDKLIYNLLSQIYDQFNKCLFRRPDLVSEDSDLWGIFQSLEIELRNALPTYPAFKELGNKLSAGGQKTGLTRAEFIIGTYITSASTQVLHLRSKSLGLQLDRPVNNSEVVDKVDSFRQKFCPPEAIWSDALQLLHQSFEKKKQPMRNPGSYFTWIVGQIDHFISCREEKERVRREQEEAEHRQREEAEKQRQQEEEEKQRQQEEEKRRQEQRMNECRRAITGQEVGTLQNLLKDPLPKDSLQELKYFAEQESLGHTDSFSLSQRAAILRQLNCSMIA